MEDIKTMYSVIILAAGIGSRMGLGYNKMLHEINHIPVVILTIKKFLSDSKCAQLIVVVNEQEFEQMQELLKKHGVTDEKVELAVGGSERQYSVYNGLQVVDQDIVLVHDGARPFVTQEMIDTCLDQVQQDFAAIVAVPVKDTIKRVIDGVVEQTPNRAEMYAVQTPQAAKTSVLRLAHQEAQNDQFLGTDEASLIEKYTSTKVKVVKGEYTNIKLTTPEDLLVAQELLKGVKTHD